MLRPVREEAGLGSPLSAFITSESLNAMPKRKTDYKKHDLPVFVQHLKELIEEQQREIERAIIGRGKYEFTKEYKYLEISEDKWFKMTTQQRERHIQKVNNTLFTQLGGPE